ncbi:MAG: hypothetical protein ACK5LJ_02480 [Paracoccus sp. (in: a-proteobacteria)]
MTRENFILATALILLAAFILGWLISWMINRLSGPVPIAPGSADQLAIDLHEAEEARDRAIAEGNAREAALHERLAFMNTELTDARKALQEASEEIEELREYIDRHLSQLGQA